MTYLTKDEIVDLDKRIDQRIDTFPLLARPRDTALFSLLIIFDDWIDQLAAEDNLTRRRNGYHAAYDSLDFCVQWTNNCCPRTVLAGDLSTTQEILSTALSMFTEGMEYGNVWTQMSLLQRGRTRAERLTATSYRLSPVSLRDKNRDTGRMLVPSGEDPESSAEAANLNPETSRSIWTKIRKLKKQRQLTYSIRGRDLDWVEESLASRSLLEWQMDATWDLGGYTVADLRRFWTSLQAIQAVHDIARRGVIEQEGDKIPEVKQLSWRLVRKSNNEWVNKISNRSGLSFSKTQQIISDLTYDESLYGPRKQDPHVLFTPFFAFDNGLIGLSGKVVQISNIERNIWSNVYRRRKGIIDGLKDEKETFWIGEISEKLKVVGFECVPRIGFTFDGAPRNLDLLVLSRKERFGLVCELKWITGSDDVKAVISLDDEIAYGVNQALISEQWLSTNLSVISKKTNIAEAELESYTFKPLVLTKEGLPSGFAEKPRVPVISENLLKWILIDPHRLGLKRLWDLADSADYLPIEDVHFKNISPEIKWGNLTFELHNLAFEGLARWRPADDIK